MNCRIDLISVRKGFGGQTFWGQARAGTIPGAPHRPPTVVLTAQPALRSGSDVYCCPFTSNASRITGTPAMRQPWCAARSTACGWSIWSTAAS